MMTRATFAHNSELSESMPFRFRERFLIGTKWTRNKRKESLRLPICGNTASPRTPMGVAAVISHSISAALWSREMKSIYPKAFVTPSGRVTSIKSMANALRVIRANPDADYPGWYWFSVPGHFILAEFRRGLNDRINRRGMLK